MLRASIFLLAPLLSAGLVAVFGFAALAACFGLAFLTLVFSTGASVEADDAPERLTRPEKLFS